MSDRPHEHFLRRAIALAANAPDLPFGVVIADRDTGEIVAEGWNRTALNPTWHGEIDAINRLDAAAVGSRRLVLYTTAEPCPMCMGAILWSGIEAVVYGTSIRTLQRQGWRQIDVFADEIVRRSPSWTCEVIGGVLEHECDALFAAARENPTGRPRILFAFAGADAGSQWEVVNDGVMGGVSRGEFAVTDRQTLEFFGVLSLENNGGFASVRTKAQKLGLKAGDTLVLKVRGDGRRFTVQLYVNGSPTAFAYRAALPTASGEWVQLQLPLADFEASRFGRPVATGTVVASEVNGMGFLLSDGQAGAFKLEVESIMVRAATVC